MLNLFKYISEVWDLSCYLTIHNERVQFKMSFFILCAFLFFIFLAIVWLEMLVRRLGVQQKEKAGRRRGWPATGRRCQRQFPPSLSLRLLGQAECGSVQEVEARAAMVVTLPVQASGQYFGLRFYFLLVTSLKAKDRSCTVWENNICFNEEGMVTIPSTVHHVTDVTCPPPIQHKTSAQPWKPADVSRISTTPLH